MIITIILVPSHTRYVLQSSMGGGRAPASPCLHTIYLKNQAPNINAGARINYTPEYTFLAQARNSYAYARFCFVCTLECKIRRLDYPIEKRISLY